MSFGGHFELNMSDLHRSLSLADIQTALFQIHLAAPTYFDVHILKP